MQRFKQVLPNGLVKTHVYLIIAVAVAAIVAAVGFFLIRSSAAGFFASLAASQANVTGNAQLITDATAFDGKAILFKAPPTSPPMPPPTGSLTCPAFPAFPDENCTGWKHTGVTLKNCDDRTDNGYIWDDNPNKTFNECYFSQRLVIEAANVVITKSQIHGYVTGYGGNNRDLRGAQLIDVEIENCFSATDCTTVNPYWDDDTYGNAAIGDSNFSCLRCHVHNTVTGAHPGDYAEVRDSYFHDFQIEPDTNDQNAPLRSHGAAVGEGQNKGHHSRIIHNNLQCNRLPGQYQQCSSAISLYDEPRLDDVLVQNNLFNAVNGFCAYGGGSNGTNIRFIDNYFGKKFNPWCGGQDRNGDDREISVAFFYFPNDFVSKNGGDDGGCTFPQATSPKCNFGNVWQGNKWADGSGEALPNRDSRR